MIHLAIITSYENKKHEKFHTKKQYFKSDYNKLHIMFIHENRYR